VKTEHQVGKYRLGFKWVRLVADTNSSGGRVILLPEDKGSPVVYVGIQGPWVLSVTTLLHELYEAALIDLNTRFEMNPSLSSESSEYLFVVTHNQLDEAHEKVGRMLIQALPDLFKAHKKYSTYKE